MFNNNTKKKDNPKAMSSDNSESNLPSVNMISEGTTLEGTLKTQSDIRVAGTIDGEANAKGKVIVSSTGDIQGNIQAADADIAGKVDGEIRVTDKLVLRKSALVEGNIYTQTLLVEEGAQINGEFHMDDASASSKRRKSSSNGLSGKHNSPKGDKTDKEKT